MPKVSVIIPVYGVEKYIERCANSLFSQTLDDIEFIFIDDCTPDKSIELLQRVIEDNRTRIAEKKWDVRIVRMPTNSGQAAVRRHGIQLATGEFVIHCDSDDWVESSAYEKMYYKAVKDDCDVVICDYFISDGLTTHGIKYLPSTVYADKSHYWKSLLRGRASTSLWSKLVKSGLYKNDALVFPQNNMWEDFVLSIQLTSFAAKIGYVEECLYNYYYNPLSITNTNIERNHMQIMENASFILTFVESPNNLQSYTKEDIICFKEYARYELSKHVGTYKYWRMWHNTFPEIKLEYLFVNGISIREKARFLSIFLGFYPIVTKVLSSCRHLCRIDNK